MEKEYKGFLIFEESDRETWEKSYRTADKKVGTDCLAFYGDTVKEVEEHIDTFLAKSLTPDTNDSEDTFYHACFHYHSSHVLKWGYNPEKIKEYLKDKYMKSNEDVFYDISFHIDIFSSWKVRENSKLEQIKANVKSVKVSGEYREEDKYYSFNVTYRKDSPYVDIAIGNKEYEHIADKIARLIGVYDAKELALETNEKYPTVKTS